MVGLKYILNQSEARLYKHYEILKFLKKHTNFWNFNLFIIPEDGASASKFLILFQKYFGENIIDEFRIS